jgi:hemolysin activation/secretion protein
MQTLYPLNFNYKRYGFAGFGLAGTYKLNKLDDLIYPYEGTEMDISLKGIYNPMTDLRYLIDTIETDNSLSSFSKLYINIDHYHPLGPRLNYNLGLSLGLSTDEFIASDYFFVGGHKSNLRRNQVAFVGYNPGEVIATHLFRLNMGLNYRSYSNFQIATLVNGSIASDNFSNLLQSTLEMDEESLHLGYGAGVTYNTLFGPLSIFIAGNNKESRLIWYINLGFTF